MAKPDRRTPEDWHGYPQGDPERTARAERERDEGVAERDETRGPAPDEDASEADVSEQERGWKRRVAPQERARTEDPEAPREDAVEQAQPWDPD